MGMVLTWIVWRQAAENVAESLTNGMRIIVTGRLKSRSFQTREGENRTVFEIDVDEVGPSLRYASAQVARNPREGGQGGNFGGNQGGGQAGGNQGGFGGNQGGGSQSSNQGGFGGNQSSGGQSQPANDPWNSAPPAGGFGGDDEPPF